MGVACLPYSVPNSFLGTERHVVSVTAVRPDGTRETFAFADRGGYIKSKNDIRTLKLSRYRCYVGQQFFV